MKEHPYLTFAQLSNQCLPLGRKALGIHRLQWLCPCSDTDAAVISRYYQLLNSNGFLREKAARIFDAYVNIGSLDANVRELRRRYPEGKVYSDRSQGHHGR